MLLTSCRCVSSGAADGGGDAVSADADPGASRHAARVRRPRPQPAVAVGPAAAPPGHAGPWGVGQHTRGRRDGQRAADARPVAAADPRTAVAAGVGRGGGRVLPARRQPDDCRPDSTGEGVAPECRPGPAEPPRTQTVSSLHCRLRTQTVSSLHCQPRTQTE